MPTAEPSPTPIPTPEQVVYTVKSGDTLSKIAAAYGVTVEDILAANPSITDPNQIAPGDKIVIPQPRPVRDRGRGDHARSVGRRRLRPVARAAQRAGGHAAQAGGPGARSPSGAASG